MKPKLKFKVTRRHSVRGVVGPIPMRKQNTKPDAINNEPRGLGDTVANVLKKIKADKLAEFYTKLTGKDCGCKKRQEWLNELVPYDNK